MASAVSTYTYKGRTLLINCKYVAVNAYLAYTIGAEHLMGGWHAIATLPHWQRVQLRNHIQHALGIHKGAARLVPLAPLRIKGYS